jgi:hypothetical protein
MAMPTTTARAVRFGASGTNVVANHACSGSVDDPDDDDDDAKAGTVDGGAGSVAAVMVALPGIGGDDINEGNEGNEGSRLLPVFAALLRRRRPQTVAVFPRAHKMAAAPHRRPCRKPLRSAHFRSGDRVVVLVAQGTTARRACGPRPTTPDVIG